MLSDNNTDLVQPSGKRNTQAEAVNDIRRSLSKARENEGYTHEFLIGARQAQADEQRRKRKPASQQIAELDTALKRQNLALNTKIDELTDELRRMSRRMDRQAKGPFCNFGYSETALELWGIANRVCHFYGNNTADIMGRGKAQKQIIPRDHFCYLAKTFTKHSNRIIAQFLGYRDIKAVTEARNRFVGRRKKSRRRKRLTKG